LQGEFIGYVQQPWRIFIEDWTRIEPAGNGGYPRADSRSYSREGYIVIRSGIGGFGVLTALAAALVFASQATAAPNFVVIIADDMAWNDAGAYGHPHIRTPNIDRLAAEGMRFDRAFLSTSSCSPPWTVTTVGVPQAIASTAVMPNGS